MKRIVIGSLALVVLLAWGCSRREKPAGEARPAGAVGTSTTASPSAPTVAAPAASDPELSRRLLDFKAQKLDGSEFSFASMKGKPMFVNMWATWCPPCRAELPELKKLSEAETPRGLQLIGVSIDDPGAVPAVQQFVTDLQINYEIVMDPGGNAIASILHTSVIPTSVLLDKQGNVVWYFNGPFSRDDPKFRSALRAALQ